MKKIILSLVVAFGVIGVVAYYNHQKNPEIPKIGAVDFNFTSATMASSTVGIYTSTLMLATSTDISFARFCNANPTLTASNDVYLQLGASSTKPFGIIVKPSDCYTMNSENLFRGPIYGIASTATSTLLMLYK